MTSLTNINAPWLQQPDLQKLLIGLEEGGEEARLAGGCVRNGLLNEPINDIDIATTCLPDETIRRVEALGFRAVKTGYDHGTITAVSAQNTFEITTLRADMETDGRHAKVHFGRDWQEDANRRDFTMNGLYLDRLGNIYDLVDGIKDINARMIRFIGDANARIEEDYLRILRFFRFFAYYGTGRPDADGIRASAKLKSGLDTLSAERVWSELKKLMSAPNPQRALLWMRQAGVLTRILPESEHWGIDAIHALMELEDAVKRSPDSMIRLMAIIPPNSERVETLATRLKLSTAERKRLEEWANAFLPEASMSEKQFAPLLYSHGTRPFIDRLILAQASARGKAMNEGTSDNSALMEAGGYGRLIDFAQNWQKPEFPIKGRDLASIGFEAGKAMGACLAQLEEVWIASDFKMSSNQLLKQASALLKSAK